MGKVLNEIRFVRGDTSPWEFTLEDETGTGIDLTGYDLAVTVRKTAITTSATISYETTNFTTTGETSGVIILNILPADTSSLTAGIYVYDLQITSGAGVVTTPICNEKFIIEQDVTY